MHRSRVETSEDFGHAREAVLERPGPVHSSRFVVGGVSVQLAGDYEVDTDLVPSLRQFSVRTGVSDIHIQVERVAGLRRSFERQLFDSGSIWQLYEDEGGFQFDFSARIFGEEPYKRLLVDERFRWATLQLNARAFVGNSCMVAPLDYPLDELLIMHRLTQEKAIELHSCGIVRADGTGDLFVGHSGAGKSTTTRLWTEREDVEVLSDDRIIVRRDEGGSAIETSRAAAGAAGEREVLRLRDHSASPTGHSAQDDKLGKRSCSQVDKPNKPFGMRMYGTPWHGEAMYASPGSAPLSRIFILEHGYGNVLTRLSASQAVAELFARSFVPFHRHEYVDSALEFLQELASAVPVYHYAFEPTEAAVERILELRD
jgi:hypothetical protein